jgi:hypothetical protein
MNMQYLYDNCPNCNVSFIGDEIPKDMQHHYTPPYYWRKEISIDGGFLGIYAGIIAYECHECKHIFPRSQEPWAIELYNKYKEICNNDKTK